MLQTARAAESEHDYVRAAWAAENALALDVECVEAQQILRRARAKLEAQPSLTDETVDVLRSEDTVRIGQRASRWHRVAAAVRSWSQSGQSPPPARSQAADRPRAKR